MKQQRYGTVVWGICGSITIDLGNMDMWGHRTYPVHGECWDVGSEIWGKDQRCHSCKVGISLWKFLEKSPAMLNSVCLPAAV